MRTVKLNGKRLKELRAARGMSVLALAEKAEISEGTIKTTEADGEKAVYPGTLAALAKALQVSNEELLVDGQPPVKMVRVTFEMPVPFEEFQQQVHGERLLEILTWLLKMRPTITGIERGSTKVIVEMTEDEAFELYGILSAKPDGPGKGTHGWHSPIDDQFDLTKLITKFQVDKYVLNFPQDSKEEPPK